MDWMITALVLSLLGSVHCMGMCGGFAMLAHTGTSAPKNASFSVYLFGKTVSYIAIGAVLGMIGEGLHGVPFGARMLSLLTGLFMILVGLHMAGVHALTRFVTPRSSGTLVGWLSRSVSIRPRTVERTASVRTAICSVCRCGFSRKLRGRRSFYADVLPGYVSVPVCGRKAVRRFFWEY